jgi:O-antigen/teichoic acid export membrane protein
MLVSSKFFKSKDFRRLFENFFNFSFFQVTNFLVPFITIPYIVRIIGPEKFGVIAFAQAVIAYLMIVVDYGFDISATAKIAKFQNNKDTVSIIYNSVFFIRLLLMSVMLIFMICLFFLWEEIKQYILIYILSFAIIPGNILISAWFFTGMEKAKYLNFANTISRIFYMISIFLLIKNSKHYYLVPAINSASVILCGIISFCILIVKFKISFKMPHWSDYVENFKEGWHVFFANFFINLYRNSNILILGFLASKDIVGIYGAGEKIVKAIQSIFAPITNTFYPFISRLQSTNKEKSIKAIKLLLLILGTATFIIATFLFLYSDLISNIFLGDKFLKSNIVIKLSSYVIFFGILNYIIGIIFMINFKLQKEFKNSVIVTGIFNIFFCYIASSLYMEKGTAVSFLSSEIMLFLMLLFYIKKNREIIKSSE